MPNNEEEEKSRGSWTKRALFFVGLWLIATAFSFDHKSDALLFSDLLSGVLLLFFILGNVHRFWIAALGLWLQIAPLVFWAPKGLSYLNDTLIGVLIIALSLLVDQPRGNKALCPKGWSYNPSTWVQRFPVIFFGFVAWMCARLMAAFQLGYIDTVWDPVFGQGTVDVISSSISKDFPVPDAGLGALAYTVETLMALHGGESRYHTHPWFVRFFALLVIPVGLVSTLLIILQPLIVGHWCFWCLITALAMLFMIVFAVDEVVATYTQEVVEKPFKDHFLWGVSFPWTLVLSSLIGLIMMFHAHSPIIGAFVAVASILSFAQVLRRVHLVNILLAIVFVLIDFSFGNICLAALLMLLTYFHPSKPYSV